MINTNENPNENALFTLPKLAQYLRLVPQTVWRMTKTGEIPGFQVGSEWRYSTKDIAAWIAGKMNTRKS